MLLSIRATILIPVLCWAAILLQAGIDISYTLLQCLLSAKILPSDKYVLPMQCCKVAKIVISVILWFDAALHGVFF